MLKGVGRKIFTLKKQLICKQLSFRMSLLILNLF